MLTDDRRVAGKISAETDAPIPVLISRGVTVATIKHAHHGFDIDQPGKDSWLHREAGAGEVAIVSSRRWAIVHELRNEEEPSLADILAKLSPVDLVIVESFKRDRHSKLEVYRAAVGKPLMQPHDDTIVAVAADEPLPKAQVPVLMLDNVELIASVLQAEARNPPPRQASQYAGGTIEKGRCLRESSSRCRSQPRVN